MLLGILLDSFKCACFAEIGNSPVANIISVKDPSDLYLLSLKEEAEFIKRRKSF